MSIEKIWFEAELTTYDSGKYVGVSDRFGYWSESATNAAEFAKDHARKLAEGKPNIRYALVLKECGDRRKMFPDMVV